MSKNSFKNVRYIPAGKLIAGVDVGKKNSWGCGITFRGEKIFKSFIFGNNREGFEKFLGRLKRWMKEADVADLVVGMEPSGPYWVTLAQYLELNGIEVLLVNPYHVKKTKEMFDNSPRKNDRKDAYLIARLVDEGKFLRRAELTEELENLRHLMNDREYFVERKTAIINRIRSLLAEYFPEFEEVFKNIALKSIMELMSEYPLPCDVIKAGEEKITKLLHKASRGKLGSVKSRLLLEKARKTVGNNRALEQARNSIRRNIKELEHILGQINPLEKEIEALAPGVPGYEYLLSIPDVKALTICSLLCATGDLRRYNSANEVLKMIGMDVCEFSSGKWQGKRRISKRGNPMPRRYFYQAAARSSKKKGIYHEKYCKMKSRGKESPVVFVAIACDLVRIMYSLVRDERRFERDYSPGGRKKDSDGQKSEGENSGKSLEKDLKKPKSGVDCAPGDSKKGRAVRNEKIPKCGRAA